MIRPARPSDAAAICDIWNPIIRETLVTFNPVEKTICDVEAMCAAKGDAFLIAENESGAIEGFASYGQFRGGEGYKHTCEHTILLAPQARGRGVGRRLMSGLTDHARTVGYHSMWAGVSAENPGAVAFHRSVGFVEVATLPQVGFKFGRWIDLILMQKML